MTFLIQQTLIYAVPLMIVALAGVFAERSGIINLALEGIMVFGAFIGVWFVRILQTSDAILSLKQSGNWVALQGVELLTMLVAAAFGALFSLLLSFASINLRADQTIGGTALNLMAPALVLFFIRIIANQNTLNMASGDSASWFMIKKSTLGIDKSVDLGFFGETFINKVYLATYVCILVFIILSILLYKTRFGLRLRACGAGEDLHHLSQSGAGFRVPSVARLAQKSVFHQLPGKLRQGFFQRDAFFQAVQGHLLIQFPGKGHIILYKLLQLFHVRGKGGVVKAAVNNVQIPYFVHDLSLLTVFTAILHQSSPSVNCPHGLPHFVEKCRKVLDIRRNCRKRAVFDERLFLFFLAKLRASWYSLFVAHGFS